MKTSKPEIPGAVLMVVAFFAGAVIQAFGLSLGRVITHPLTSARSMTRGRRTIDKTARWCEVCDGQAD
jgi:hypothetical protein